MSSSTPKPPEGALAVQEGGDHYKSLPIQPVEYAHANKIPFAEGSVIKYVTRHRSKNREQDIKKAMHFLALILKLEYKIDAVITYPEQKGGDGRE